MLIYRVFYTILLCISSMLHSMDIVPSKIPLMHYVITSLPKEAQDRTIKCIQRLCKQDEELVEVDLWVTYKNTRDNSFYGTEIQRKMPQLLIDVLVYSKEQDVGVVLV